MISSLLIYINMEGERHKAKGEGQKQHGPPLAFSLVAFSTLNLEPV